MVTGMRVLCAGLAACCVRAGRVCGARVGEPGGGREARLGVCIAGRGVAVLASAGGLVGRAWRTGTRRTFLIIRVFYLADVYGLAMHSTSLQYR